MALEKQPQTPEHLRPRQENCPSDLSDEEQVQRCLAGESTASGELFCRHWHWACSVARRILGNDADAEDAVAEAFGRAFAALGGFRGESSFRTWLYRIVSHAALDIKRQTKRRRTYEARTTACRPFVENVTPHDKLVAKEQMKLISSALRRWATFRERLVWRLHFHEDMTYPEIAGILPEMTKGQVKNLVDKLRRQLKRHLARQGYSLTP